MRNQLTDDPDQDRRGRDPGGDPDPRDRPGQRRRPSDEAPERNLDPDETPPLPWRPPYVDGI